MRTPEARPAAGEPLELVVRLVATATRGSVAVDLFGFSATSPDDLHRMFGLRPLAGEPASAASPLVR